MMAYGCVAQNEDFQEPSDTDKRAVRDDPDLKGEFYEGELVISQKKVYLRSSVA